MASQLRSNGPPNGPPWQEEKVSFHCKKPGHNAKDCPEKDKQA